MKIKKVTENNRKKAFEIAAAGKSFLFPYAKLKVSPSRKNPITRLYVDKGLGGEGFTYELQSGDEGTVHIDHVLEYNRDQRYMRDLLLYNLTLKARKRVQDSPLSKREIIRRLNTSAAQFYRLLDQTNYKKSIDQLTALLQVLDCEVDLVVRKKRPRLTRAV